MRQRKRKSQLLGHATDLPAAMQLIPDISVANKFHKLHSRTIYLEDGGGGEYLLVPASRLSVFHPRLCNSQLCFIGA